MLSLFGVERIIQKKETFPLFFFFFFSFSHHRSLKYTCVSLSILNCAS